MNDRKTSGIMQGRGIDENTLTATSVAEELDTSTSGLPERWEVLRLLGAGGQAVVWLAIDSRLNETVAVKERAATSWPDRALLPLAQWAAATVLETQGEQKEARELYLRAAEAAPATFFGQEATRKLSRTR